VPEAKRVNSGRVLHQKSVEEPKRKRGRPRLPSSEKKCNRIKGAGQIRKASKQRKRVFTKLDQNRGHIVHRTLLLDELRARFPDLTYWELMGKASEIWQKLSDEEHERYHDMYNKDYNRLNKIQPFDDGSIVVKDCAISRVDSVKKGSPIQQQDSSRNTTMLTSDEDQRQTPILKMGIIPKVLKEPPNSRKVTPASLKKKI
jgi:hypothetical protein